MKEPNKIPLDPSTPRAKDVKKIPLTRLDQVSIEDEDRPDRDSIYTTIKNNENFAESPKT